MRHWWQLATRNWRAKPGRAIASTVAIALGVATVVSITCFYESVRQAITGQVVSNWLGNSHLTVEPPLAHWGRVDQQLAEPLAKLENIALVNCRLKRVLTVIRSAPGEALKTSIVDAIGIDPTTEYRFRTYPDVQGRLIQPGERGVAVVETASAKEWDMDIGDDLRIAVSADRPPQAFKIVGTYDLRRVAEFQRPTVLLALSDLQELKGEQGQVTSIDLMLHDTSSAALEAATQRARGVVDEWNQRDNQNWQVSSAQTKLEQLDEAERVTQMALMLVAFIALLTSFFIIVTTMSMGIMERITAMGMMRCLGVTRGQLAWLVLIEVMPIGIVGVLIGIPIGLALTWLGAVFVPEFVQEVLISKWGMWLAVIGGLLTTLGAAAVLVVQVARVSPLEAANPEAKPARVGLAILSAVVGIVMLAVHEWMLVGLDAPQYYKPVVAFAMTGTLYLGYVLLAPALVLVAGAVVIHVAAAAMRIRPKLARDQVGRSPWRSAAVCWMLIVGLSLIVYISVRGESVTAAWDFPKKLPATFVWSPDPVPYSLRAAIEQLPGVNGVTVVREFGCKAGDPEREATSFLESFRQKLANPVPATFVAGEMETFLAMTKLGFLEGDLEDAAAKLAKGGYVLLPPESARTYGLDVGDKVTLSVGPRSAEFEVAGVVESPALDIAVTFFQADSYFMLAAAGSFLGTLADARDKFGVDWVTMFMVNVDLDETPVPIEFHVESPPDTAHRVLVKSMLEWADRLPNERATFERLTPKLRAFLVEPSAGMDVACLEQVNRFALAVNDTGRFWKHLNAQQRWDMFREQLVLRNVAFTMGRPHAMTGSLRTLKEAMDEGIRQATLLMSAMPAVAVFVAALGVANLMMVNVAARSRQIAVIRAVGATKSQITRLVLAEALTLGMLGSILGVALGMHSAISADVFTTNLFGIHTGVIVPWLRVCAAVLLTLLVCVVAGIAPARRAARSNVVDALAAG